jgi:DNA-binding transcriptional LysR family regulator
MIAYQINTSHWAISRYSDAIMQPINWDNLRYVLMVANKGSIAAAARELGVNRSTVLRRIDAFQDSLDCRIFERGDSGYTLTVEAEKMIEAAREVESTLYNMQREIAGRELRLEGELSVTTTDSLMVTMMGPILAGFNRIHPQIVLDVIVTNNVLDLNRRDADIAIRPTGMPQPPLIGYKLREVEVGIYASKNYMAGREADDWLDYQWIGLDQSFLAAPFGKWFEATIPTQRICMRADSFITIKIAAEHDIGAALLPCFIGDESNSLICIDTLNQELTTGLWVLTHPDLIRSARVQAFINYIRAAFSNQIGQASSVD